MVKRPPELSELGKQVAEIEEKMKGKKHKEKQVYTRYLKSVAHLHLRSSPGCGLKGRAGLNGAIWFLY